MNTKPAGLEQDQDLSHFVLPLRRCVDVALVGGKAANLGELIRAGFVAPDGFVVTTAAFKASRASGSPGPELAASIARHYALLGGGAVAVRSSATAEDMAGASMAGQYETFLDVRSESALLDRIRHCWESLDSSRTRAYLAEQGIDLRRVAMAVVVQRLVPAEVAGVLFTVNPRTGDETQMLLEASWGLGEAVVSGEVQPDTLTLDSREGRVLEAVIAEKRMLFDPATGRERDVPEAERRRACLTSKDVYALWQLGQRAQQHFGRPQDLEWAIAGGAVYVLQSRAITTLEPQRARQAEMDAVRKQVRDASAAGGGPWVPHNISETLVAPTPLTWSVIRRFLSGRGGFGEMYRTVGFEPGPRVADAGLADLIGGRVYMDLARASDMFFADFPFAYDPAALKDNPEAGQSPPTLPGGGAFDRWRVGKKLAGVHRRIAAIAATLDRRLEQDVIPAFIAWVAQERAIDLKALPADQLAALWDARGRRVMDEFAPQSLLPSMIVGQVIADLSTLLAEHVTDQDPAALARGLSALGDEDRTVLSNRMLYAVGTGRREVQEWLEQFGHRAPGELDLAVPRWRERPDDVRRLAAQLAAGVDPEPRHREQKQAAQESARMLRNQLPPRIRAEFDKLAELLRRYVPYREDGKYYLMLGYETLRDVAVEAGRRMGADDGVFFLTDEEMKQALLSGFAPLAVIERRRARHAAGLKIELPDVIDEIALADAGRPAVSESAVGNDARQWRGFAISPGVGRGVACVVDDPVTAQTPPSGYVLVCRTTDPSWTPLFVNAAAVVLETGGSLSHGAIVAREMGVPAIVVPQARALLAGAGDVIVNADRGWVMLPGRMTEVVSPVTDADDVTIPPAQRPPPAGSKERAAGTWRNRAVLFWCIGLALLFLLPPQWLYEPALSVLDRLLWPMMERFGTVLGTAGLAALLALLTMVGQRVLSDNGRLNLAKERARILREQAESLPVGSPRRKALLAAAAPVQKRVLGAAMVPVGLLLGPLVLIFLWLPLRVDPAVTPPPEAVPIIVKAAVSGDFTKPVTLTPGVLRLTDSEPTQAIESVREALLELGRELNDADDDELQGLPWRVAAAARYARQEMLAGQAEYLSRPIPPQTLTWFLKAPETAGVYELMLSTAGAAPLRLHVAVGKRSLPQRTLVDGDPSAIQSAEILYPPKLAPDLIFARPFRFLGWSWDCGWLGVYLLAYLPAMLISRLLLRVA